MSVVPQPQAYSPAFEEWIGFGSSLAPDDNTVVVGCRGFDVSSAAHLRNQKAIRPKVLGKLHSPTHASAILQPETGRGNISTVLPFVQIAGELVPFEIGLVPTTTDPSKETSEAQLDGQGDATSRIRLSCV